MPLTYSDRLRCEIIITDDSGVQEHILASYVVVMKTVALPVSSEVDLYDGSGKGDFPGNTECTSPDRFSLIYGGVMTSLEGLMKRNGLCALQLARSAPWVRSSHVQSASKRNMSTWPPRWPLSFPVNTRLSPNIFVAGGGPTFIRYIFWSTCYVGVFTLYRQTAVTVHFKSN